MLSFLDRPILGRGFRPFFVLGALYSVINLLIWGGVYMGYSFAPDFMLNPMSWHAHEMIYGFTMAIVAGFLLTAVANWTGGAPVRHAQLLVLAILWIAGRLVMNVDLGISVFSALIIENAFIPALAVSLAVPLLRSWNKRNFVFLALLATLFACNVCFMLTQQHTPLYIAIMVVITMISLIGGRIIPAFTVAALRRRGEIAHQASLRKLDAMALASLVIIMLVIIANGLQGLPLSVVAFASAVIHMLRLRAYHTRRILNDPMVWILHVGYGWVIVGLVLLALSALNIVSFSIVLHSFTVGAIGSMTIGMMCRVALGHTGRALIANRATTISFILMQAAAIIRIVFPLMVPEYTFLLVGVSALLWAMCFSIYLFVYVPILFKPRPDGYPA